ncbi:MAG: DHH family phosphoesterase [Planctomycetota bacterium]|nr:DHH family phosphoesterase [Planctomycetota bacterium]
MAIDWKRFCDIIHSHHTFLVTSHIRPDCDALGSALGMALVLESLGKQVRIVTGDPVPPNLAFIDPDQRIEHLGGDVTLDQLSEIEVMMVLDTSAWAQLGPMGDVLRADRKIKMVLDHHVSEDDLGAAYFKNTTAEATGRLVAEAASELGVPLTAEIATPLFAAQATDTGWYRFKSTTGDALRVAASFVDAGAIPQEIYSDIYEQDTLGRLRLRGIVLARTETDLDGRMAHTFLRLTDFEQSGAVPSDTEDLINLTLAIKGVEFAVILVEQDAGDFKLSFRSRCGVDCSRLAQQFGGGGHKAAAGAGIDGPFEDAQPKVLKAVREAMEAVV